MSSMPENSMSLSSVLGHVSMDELNEIISDWGREDSWHWGAILNGFRVTGVNAHSWAGSHLLLVLVSINNKLLVVTRLYSLTKFSIYFDNC